MHTMQLFIKVEESSTSGPAHVTSQKFYQIITRCEFSLIQALENILGGDLAHYEITGPGTWVTWTTLAQDLKGQQLSLIYHKQPVPSTITALYGSSFNRTKLQQPVVIQNIPANEETELKVFDYTQIENLKCSVQPSYPIVTSDNTASSNSLEHETMMTEKQIQTNNFSIHATGDCLLIKDSQTQNKVPITSENNASQYIHISKLFPDKDITCMSNIQDDMEIEQDPLDVLNNVPRFSILGIDESNKLNAQEVTLQTVQNPVLNTIQYSIPQNAQKSNEQTNENSHVQISQTKALQLAQNLASQREFSLKQNNFNNLNYGTLSMSSPHKSYIKNDYSSQNIQKKADTSTFPVENYQENKCLQEESAHDDSEMFVEHTENHISEMNQGFCETDMATSLLPTQFKHAQQSLISQCSQTTEYVPHSCIQAANTYSQNICRVAATSNCQMSDAVLNSPHKRHRLNFVATSQPMYPDQQLQQHHEQQQLQQLQQQQQQQQQQQHQQQQQQQQQHQQQQQQQQHQQQQHQQQQQQQHQQQQQQQQHQQQQQQQQHNQQYKEAYVDITMLDPKRMQQLSPEYIYTQISAVQQNDQQLLHNPKSNVFQATGLQSHHNIYHKQSSSRELNQNKNHQQLERKEQSFPLTHFSQQQFQHLQQSFQHHNLCSNRNLSDEQFISQATESQLASKTTEQNLNLLYKFQQSHPLNPNVKNLSQKLENPVNVNKEQASVRMFTNVNREQFFTPSKPNAAGLESTIIKQHFLDSPGQFTPSQLPSYEFTVRLPQSGLNLCFNESQVTQFHPNQSRNVSDNSSFDSLVASVGSYATNGATFQNCGDKIGNCDGTSNNSGAACANNVLNSSSISSSNCATLPNNGSLLQNSGSTCVNSGNATSKNNSTFIDNNSTLQLPNSIATSSNNIATFSNNNINCSANDATLTDSSIAFSNNGTMLSNSGTAFPEFNKSGPILTQSGIPNPIVTSVEIHTHHSNHRLQFSPNRTSRSNSNRALKTENIHEEDIIIDEDGYNHIDNGPTIKDKPQSIHHWPSPATPKRAGFSIETELLQIEGWCPHENGDTIKKTMEIYLSQDGSYVVWKSRRYNNFVITVSHLRRLFYFLVNEIKHEAKERTVYYLFEGGFRSESLLDLLQHYRQNSIRISMQNSGGTKTHIEHIKLRYPVKSVPKKKKNSKSNCIA